MFASLIAFIRGYNSAKSIEIDQHLSDWFVVLLLLQPRRDYFPFFAK